MNIGGADQATALERDPAQEFNYLALDQLPIGVFHKDKAGRFTFVNSWYCRFKGVEARDFIGKTADQVGASQWARELLERPEKLRELKFYTDGASHHEIIMRTGQSVEVEEQHLVGDLGAHGDGCGLECGE